MPNPSTILVTGGAGFIGSAVVRYLMGQTSCEVVNVDKLTYAAKPASLESLADDGRYHFEPHDIGDFQAMKSVFARYRPDAVLHLAAESHVDRSIDASAVFIQTNIVGTHVLLEVVRDYLKGDGGDDFRFLHVSTDEVYGELGPSGDFCETSPFRPNSPYSASKASADLLVRAWHRTYGLPVLHSHCGNNYGPWQHHEKLIPRMVSRALAGLPLPVFGSGLQVRDWIHVEDHARALVHLLEYGEVGESYNVGARCERSNLAVIETVCQTLDQLVPVRPEGVERFSDLLCHVEDRPGHDFRYALDTRKIEQLGWSAQIPFESGLPETVEAIRREFEYSGIEGAS